MKEPVLEDLDSDRKEGLRPSIVCCCINEKQLLFLHKKEYNLWMLPQGGVNNKETLGEALFRELTEEMGKEFTVNCEKDFIVLGDDVIEFLPGKHNVEDLFTDDGTKVELKGKKFYFCALACLNRDFDIGKTEFNDYFWLEYKGAKGMADKIYQKGKRRVTLKIIELLKENNLIS